MFFMVYVFNDVFVILIYLVVLIDCDLSEFFVINLWLKKISNVILRFDKLESLMLDVKL